MRLDGKIAVVTGAGRGLGKGIALKLASLGATVIAADLLEESVDALAREVNATGGEARGYRLDISSRQAVEEMFDAVTREYGTVDILVNNAGVNRDAMLHKMLDEQWNEVIAVNLTGTYYCTQCAAKWMRGKKAGRIISIASASWLGNLGQANYAASKAGVVGLTKTAARELARYGVTCNAICPGFIDTDMTRSIPQPAWDAMVSKIPMGRVGSAEDVANVVAFLASEEAGYVTAEVINVGGGMIL